MQHTVGKKEEMGDASKNTSQAPLAHDNPEITWVGYVNQLFSLRTFLEAIYIDSVAYRQRKATDWSDTQRLSLDSQICSLLSSFIA